MDMEEHCSIDRDDIDVPHILHTHLPRDSTAHSGLDPSALVNNQCPTAMAII